MTTAALPRARARTRWTGPLAGGLRALRLLGTCVTGVVRVRLADARGGQPAARREFAHVALEMADVFGVVVEQDGALDPEAHEIRVANHTSYLDILVLAGVDAGRFFSRHDVAEWPMVGDVAKRIGTLFVDRESKMARASALRGLVRAVVAGGAVVVFPEGKTSSSTLLPFQSGAFIVARMARVPVRPLAVEYDDLEAAAWVGDATLPPHVWSRLSGDYIHARVRPLPPIEPVGTIDEMAEDARQRIGRALGRDAGPAGPVIRKES